MVGLEALAPQVALAVEHGLGLAGGAARERHEAGVVGRERGRRSGLGREERLVGDEDDRALRARRLELRAVALVGDDERGPRHGEAQAQVAGAQLLRTRQHDGAEAKAGDHRQDPLRPVADEREHDVAASHPAGRQRPGEPSGAIGHCAEAPRAAGPVASELDERERAGVGGIDDVAGEIHHGSILWPWPRQP